MANETLSSSDLGLEINMNLSMDTIAKVAGDICVELLRQSHALDTGENTPPSLESIAFHAHRLAWICCTGQMYENTSSEGSTESTQKAEQ